MRRRDHPSFPSAITCCFLSVLKTLLMPSEPIRALSGVNVPGFPMAGFQLTLYGRIWATPEVEEGHCCQSNGLEFLSFPIEDRSVPPSLDEFDGLLNSVPVIRQNSSRLASLL